MRRVLVAVLACGVLGGCAVPGVVGTAAAVPIGEQPYRGAWAVDSPVTRALSAPTEPAELAQLQAHDAAVQDAIVACMAGRGLTYLPTVGDAASYAAVLDVEPTYPDVTRQQFAETWGFGISTADLLPQDDGPPTTYPATEDPNAAAYEAMDDATRLAWDTALYGPEELSDEGGTTGADVDLGCYGTAYEAVDGADATDTGPDPALVAAEESLSALEEQVRSDPRAVAATSDYTVCMRAAGYELDAADAAWTDASDRFYEASGDDVLGAMTDDEYDALTDEQRSALEEQAAPDPAELAALQAQEIDEAVADLRCLGPSEPALTAVRTELESAYVATHPTELGLLRTSYGG